MGQPREPQSNELIIVYSGRLADENTLPLSDLIESLTGWDHLFQLAQSSLDKGLLATPPRRRKSQIAIRSVRPGSVEVVLDLGKWIAAVAAAGFIGARADASVSLLYRFVKKLIESHRDSKEQAEFTDDMIEALHRLAAESDVRVPQTETETIRVIESIDESIRHATGPLDESSETISLRCAGIAETFAITTDDRKVFRRPLPPVRTESEVGARIRISALNTKSGHARFEFVNPTDAAQEGRQAGYIVDPAAKHVPNVYSRALHQGEHLTVRVRRDENSAAFNTGWQIIGAQQDESLLF